VLSENHPFTPTAIEEFAEPGGTDEEVVSDEREDDGGD
jgi:hypothetical protein